MKVIRGGVVHLELVLSYLVWLCLVLVSLPSFFLYQLLLEFVIMLLELMHHSFPCSLLIHKQRRLLACPTAMLRSWRLSLFLNKAVVMKLSDNFFDHRRLGSFFYSNELYQAFWCHIYLLLLLLRMHLVIVRQFSRRLKLIRHTRRSCSCRLSDRII